MVSHRGPFFCSLPDYGFLLAYKFFRIWENLHRYARHSLLVIVRYAKAADYLPAIVLYHAQIDKQVQNGACLVVTVAPAQRAVIESQAYRERPVAQSIDRVMRPNPKRSPYMPIAVSLAWKATASPSVHYAAVLLARRIVRNREYHLSVIPCL